MIKTDDRPLTVDLIFLLLMTTTNSTLSNSSFRWIALPRSASFLLSHLRILLLSLFLFILTLGLTWLFYQVSMHFIDHYLGTHFLHPPAADTILGWMKKQLWVIGKWIFTLISNIIAFYAAFLMSYCLTSPGYAFLSTQVEKAHASRNLDTDQAGLTLRSLLFDLLEGCKIGAFGFVVTILALFINFIPVLGQILVFLLYCYYSCLMFIDYPASRRQWTLGKKIHWLQEHPWISFRLGILPALISLIPVINIFLMALIFPLLTVHSTLNFSSLELALKEK